ncbi:MULTISPECIES: hypothetical protein [unclassified Chryseobacterium]|uniref:hypothetical protein n=1 Tax=unclassified Chryseobacterium TaxID=2593645 RepID=UPI0012FE997A|nr:MULTISPECIES: hypothetical protein [unclassified Chryseobacterium]
MNDITLNQIGSDHILHSEQNGVNKMTFSIQWGNQNNAAMSRMNKNQSHNDLQQGSGNSIVVTQSN